MEKELYTDTLYGFIAEAPSKTMAWMLIRNKCYEEKLPVPTMDKIELVKKPKSRISTTK